MVWDLDLLNRENKLFSEVHFYIENKEDKFFRMQLKFYQGNQFNKLFVVPKEFIVLALT